jgi:hypothetical protein
MAPMRKKYGRIFRAEADFLGERVGQRQIGGERKYPAQPGRMAQAGVQRNGATLGKAGKKNIFLGDAACLFLRNKLFDFQL